MGFGVFAVAIGLNQSVVVPPVPSFRVGRSVSRNFRLTSFDANAGTKIETGTMISMEKATEPDGIRLYSLRMTPDHNPVFELELRTDLLGRPLNTRCGDGAFLDSINSLLYLIRCPLWPTGTMTKEWLSTIPNPDQAGAAIAATCSAKMLPSGKSILLRQSTKDSLIEHGFGAILEAELTVNLKSGEVTALHESIEIVKDGKSSVAVVYEEKM